MTSTPFSNKIGSALASVGPLAPSATILALIWYSGHMRPDQQPVGRSSIVDAPIHNDQARTTTSNENELEKLDFVPPIRSGGTRNATLNESATVCEGAHALAYKTLITQEMLGKGYLASNLIFSSLAHTPDVVDGYFSALDPIFGLIKECEQGRDVMSLLKGPICHAGFKRLN